MKPNFTILLIAVIELLINPITTWSASQTPIKTKAKCLEAGGVWGTMYQNTQKKPSCHLKAADSGKPCKDGKDCLTRNCEYNPQTKQGSCYSYYIRMGCRTWLEDGKMATLCVD